MKENAGAQRKGGYAAALRAKQAAVAAGDDGAAAPLPRVAVLSSHSRLASHPIRSPLLSSLSDRPLSSHKGRPARSQQTAAAQRVGCRPATHSQQLVPLADAAARAPAGTLASRAPRQPSVSSSVVIGDPGLDAAEQALQAELAATDRQLDRLLRQSQQRRVLTPEPAPPAATQAAAVPAVVLGVPAAAVLSPASVLQPAVRQPSPEPLQEQEQQEQAIPPQDQSIVRSVVTAMGTGCKDIIAPHTGAALQPGACWTSRGHRTLRLESSAILQLWGRTNADVTLRITFADAASVPRIVRLEHAPTPTAAFERLGDIKLQAKSLTQLKHLFRLGKNLEVQRCLRITLLGHMAEEDSGAHRVTHMLLTSSAGPQRSGSALSHATFAPPDPLSARSAQASVNHAPGQQPHLDFITPRDQATPDSGAALPPPLSAYSAAPAPAAAAAEAAAVPAPAPEAQPQSSSGSQPRVPPLPLASILSGGSSASASRGPAPSAQPTSQPQPAPEEGEAASDAQVPNNAAESAGAPAAERSAGIPAQQAQSIRAELDFLLLAEEFAAATQVQQEVEEEEEQEQEKEEQGDAAPEAEAAVPASQAADRLRASTAVPLMLLPAQRCSDVAATLSKLQLLPEQAKRAVLQLLDFCGSVADEHAEDLLACLPSREECAVLSGYDGAPDALSSSEQFMLEMMAVPALDARVEAWRFAARSAARADSLRATATLLAGACGEVQHSELLRTLLKVALLAGSFLNAGNKDGAASGFQVDALLRLKDVRSTRARSRTLLHFVAREVARQHPDGASLAAELPSAAAAAQLDLGAAVAELEGLAVEAREVQAALAAGGSSCAAPLAAFEATVAEQLAALQAQLDDAQAAFRHLGSAINGQRATLADPSAFFGILHAFVDELDAAHDENAEADAAADAASSARKSRRTSAGSPTASVVSEASRRSSRRSHTPENVRGSVASVRSVGQASSLQCLKHVAAGQRRSTASAAPATSAAAQQPRHPQHSPQPCLSSAAVASLGGSRRSTVAAGSPPPASSAVAVASLLGAGAAAAGGSQGAPQDLRASREQTQTQAQAQAQAGSKLSTPVEELLKESARLISSVDLGDRDGGGGGFGSAIIASEAAAASSGAVGDTAGTPDGAVVSVAVDSDAGFTTPRHELGHSQARGTVPLRYAAGGSVGEEVPAAARAAAAAGVPLAAERPAVGASNSALNVSQMRQRSLQHLSPTSTPLSSLGRQSSRSSMVSSDADGSTPASGHARGSSLRHSASPLGAAQQAQQAGHATAAACAEAGHVGGRGAAASYALRFPDLPAGREASPEAPAAARAEQQAQLRASYQAGPAADMYAYSSDEEESPAAAASRAAAAEAEAAEVLAAARPPTGFGALHSRASSCDLTFYAPFTLHQMGQSEEMEQQGLGGSFEAIVSAGSGSAWAPLAATQQRRLSVSAGGLRHVATMDAATLQRDAAAAAASMQGLTRRAAVSMPASPRGGARARPPQPLNLGRVAGRLQLHQRAVERQAQSQQLSPVLEALLDSVPTPYAAPATSAQQQGQRAQQEEPAATSAVELTADDLVDLANCTSDQEAEWAALQEMEAADREQQRQQAAERERRELAMLQALLPPAAAHAAPREPTPEWAGDRQQMREWLAVQQAAVAASTEQLQQQGEEDEEQLQQATLMVQMPGEEQAGAEAGAPLAAPLFQQLPPLPSPITTATVNLDATLARLLASAGNTPSGPLGKAAGRWEAADGEAAEDGPQQGEAVFLLEPMLPAPLGEGVRASERMAEGIPSAALRSSIECLKATMRPGSAAGLQRSGSAPPTSLSMEAAAWAAQQAQHAQQAVVQRQGSLDPAAAAAYGGEWDSGVGPARRRDHLRGLRKLLSRGRQH